MATRLLREPRSRLKQSSSGPFNEPSMLQPNSALSRGSLPSQPTSAGSGVGSKEIRKMASFTVDAGLDHTIMTMQTRVAIRDDTPHRFQVIPLRDVSKLETSSASCRENSYRLPLSATLKQKTLCPPPAILGVKSQSGLVPSTSSLKSHLATWAKESPISQVHANTVEAELNEENGSVLQVLPVSSPSFSAWSKATVLAQLDTNQLNERQRPVISSGKGVYSAASIHELIRSESPLTHTISRSLQVRTRPERNYHKSTSITEDAQPPAIPLLVGKTKLKCRSRTMSDASLPNRRLDNPGQDESYYALLNAYDPVDLKHKKRHAIYTPTLYVPNFHQSGPLRGGGQDPLDKTSQDTSYGSFQAFYGSLDKTDVNADISQPNPETTLHHSTSAINAQYANVVSRIPKELTHDSTTGSMDLLPSSTPTQHLAHQSSSQSLRIRRSTIGRPKISLGEDNSTKSDSPLQDIVYPQIIIDLLLDTDKVIEEWNRIY
ncbi:hypothetical protein HYPSUDRAFT_32170 [Hypholoma sublateritium FD-334 SS-4]|uniref:Uncharacterized protein n=1 Tax=Hypholoma sublateritium (strain FD-334 SS-4) TaxID=945553 RepID=A0A0D2LPP7_HYPSF|nr:hypothetical protein HYPSUDRAFT_32170 [Hypholoma sublateritium FD-334 SS-4]